MLLTCFNELLADDFRSCTGIVVPGDGVEEDEEEAPEVFMIGAFLLLARSIPEILHIDTDGLQGGEWETQVWAALQHHWPKVEARFDRIVIDEAQDFHPVWIGILEALLVPDGRRRMLIVADQDQGIQGRGFVLPRADNGWVQVELRSKFRNAAPIAQILRRRLGGAALPAFVPEGIGLSFRLVTDLDWAVAADYAELERITEKEFRDRRRVCVATFRSAVLNALRSELELGAWEDRDEFIVCENVHRLKGLKFDAVILEAAESVEDTAFRMQP